MSGNLRLRFGVHKAAQLRGPVRYRLKRTAYTAVVVRTDQNIYLVRHGEAMREGDDAARPLNARGHEEVERLAAYLAGIGVAVAEIRHSGKARARQTAEILAGVLHAPLAQAQGMQPDDDPAPMAASLSQETRDLLLVGHLPHLAVLATLLLRGSAHPPVHLRTAGLVHLQRDGDRWRLV